MSNVVVNERASSRSGAIRKGLVVLGGVVLTTVAAKMQVPFWPVPMTLHTLAIMAIAVTFGPRIALSVVAAYILAGATGLPVFSGSPERGIGLAYIVGPTGGYLAGYLVAAFLTGWLVQGRGMPGRVGAMAAGMAVVYVAGAAWLALYVPADKVVALGVVPFLLGDVVKIAVVAAAGPFLAKVGPYLLGGSR